MEKEDLVKLNVFLLNIRGRNAEDKTQHELCTKALAILEKYKEPGDKAGAPDFWQKKEAQKDNWKHDLLNKQDPATFPKIEIERTRNKKPCVHQRIFKKADKFFCLKCNTEIFLFITGDQI